ncbi:HDIG domain-containing protein [bacterium]|nr:HDIG domain-containing protein [bacterium]
MADWLQTILGVFRRDAAAREGKVIGRGAAKGATAKAGGAKAAAAEAKRTDRTPAWLLAAGGALLLLHLVLFPPVPRLSLDFPEAGEIAAEEIRAPFAFDAPLLDRDVEMTRLERVVVEPPVLRSLADEQSDARMELFIAALGRSLADEVTPDADKVGLLQLQFPTAGAGELGRLLRADEPDSLVPRIEAAWLAIKRGGVVDMLPAGRYDKVVVLGDQAEQLRDRDRVVAQANLQERLTAALRSAGMGPLESVETAALLRHFVRPNLVYDPDQTGERQELARQGVPTRREFISGERIVDRGVRVTQQQAVYLAALADLLIARGGGEDAGGRATRYFTRLLLVLLGLGLYGWLAVIHFRPDVRHWRRLLALTVIVALYLFGASLALSRPSLGPMGVPIVLLSLLTTVLFKGRVGYTTTMMAVVLLAVVPGVTAPALFAWFVMGMVTVLSVRRVQKRSQFYRTILLQSGLAVALIFLLGAEGLGHEGDHIYLVGVFTPILSVAFGLFLLPVVEPLVGVCSDLTLLELSDLNHPLLQRMALEAQGTYHHSQVVGQLAEHAARAIDANALLTRVGALFHDIGKMQKPAYYVENQRPESNKHDELSPSMSALVIAAHVKDGIELARKWRLPQMIIDFIPEHHGTMVMEYFYHKALEADGNETVKVDDFRYPGPKPQSRETAILMLADAMEAATRSLAKPTPSRIKEITKQILDKRMLSGELDESNLSLSDLARIRDAFVPLLTGIHHSRIVYPGQGDKGQDKVPERKGERKART